MKKMFSTTTLIAGTAVSLICSLATGYIILLALGFGGAGINGRTQYILLAIPALLILIFDILIIAKIINLSSASIITGYSVLSAGFWALLWTGMLIWYSTYDMRTNALYKKITQKGELLIEYDDIDEKYQAYYYGNKKVYHIQDRWPDGHWVSVCAKANDTDTGYYAELYENDKFTLLYKKEHSRNYSDVDYHYPPYLMYLHDVGFFKIYELGGRNTVTVSELNAGETLEDMIVMTIKAYLNNDEEILNSITYNDFGIAFLYRRGAHDNVSVAGKISFDDPVPEYLPYDTDFEPDYTFHFEELPVFSCDTDKWNKPPGIYCDTVNIDTTLSTVAKFEKKYSEADWTDSDIAKFEEIEKKSHKIIVTGKEAGTFIFYLMFMEDKWYLIAIDRFEACSA